LNTRFLQSTLFCVLSFFSTHFCAQAQTIKDTLTEIKQEKQIELRQGSQKNIDKQQENVARMMKRDWMVRILPLVAVAGVGGYFLCRSLFAGESKPLVKTPLQKQLIGVSVHTQTASDCRETVKALLPNTPLITPVAREKRSTFVSLVTCFAPPVSCLPEQGVVKKSWLKRFIFGPIHTYIMSPIRSHVAYLAVVSLAKKLWGMSSHDDTITWYSKEKTRVYQQMSQLRYYAQKIRKEKDLEAVDLDYYRETLMSMCNAFVGQVEKLCGFMQYRLEQFEKRGAYLEPDECLQVSRLISVTNKFVGSLQKKLPKDLDEPLSGLKETYADAQQFTNDLERQIGRFAEIEFEIEDRLDE